MSAPPRIPSGRRVRIRDARWFAGAPRTGRLRGPRHLLLLGLVTLVAIMTATAFGSGWSPFHGPATVGAAATCQSDGGLGCVATIPCSTSPCPSVDVGPATDLRDGQYAFVSATNFDNTGSMRVALCADNSSPSDPSCLTGNWEDQNWTPIQIPIDNDPTHGNVTEVSFPVFDDPNVPGNEPLPAHDITNTVGAVNGFFCGDAADPCDLIVTEEAGQGNAVGNGPAVDPSNSVVIPLQFAPQSSGCPSSDPQISTDSSFSLEHFLPAAVDASCGASNGVVALNIATDNDSVINDFANGGPSAPPIAFVDDPSNPSELSTLAGHSYAFIPIALSGTAVSFLAGDSIGPLPFPVASYKLTPNMVAGLISSAYEVPGGNLSPVPKPHITLADELIPPLSCANLVGCPSTDKTTEVANEQAYNAFWLLNPVSSSVTNSNTLGTFLSNVPSGASFQATDWLCNAPNVPYNVSVNEIRPPRGQTNPVTVSLTDPNSASTTLTTPPVGSLVWPPYEPAPPWVFPTCQGYSTIPPLSGVEAQFSESQSPALQAKALRGWSYGGGALPVGTTNPLAGFAIMDSSESSFNGLNDAALQNASGDFVNLSTTTLENAAADLTPCPTDVSSCPAGTYAVNYDSTSLPTDADAYPMPNVTYALVSTAPQPADQVTAEQNLLTNIVNFSHNSTSELPAGYAPLPTTLYNAATAAIKSDLVAEPSTSTTGPGSNGGGGPGSTPSTSGSGGSSGSTGSSSSGSSSDVGSTGTELPLTPATSTSNSNSGNSSNNSGNNSNANSGSLIPSATVPLGSIQLVLDNAARMLLPALLAIAVACLLIGPLLYFWPNLRRRRKSP